MSIQPFVCDQQGNIYFRLSRNFEILRNLKMRLTFVMIHCLEPLLNTYCRHFISDTTTIVYRVEASTKLLSAIRIEIVY